MTIAALPTERAVSDLVSREFVPPEPSPPYVLVKWHVASDQPPRYSLQVKAYFIMSSVFLVLSAIAAICSLMFWSKLWLVGALLLSAGWAISMYVFLEETEREKKLPPSRQMIIAASDLGWDIEYSPDLFGHD